MLLAKKWKIALATLILTSQTTHADILPTPFCWYAGITGGLTMYPHAPLDDIRDFHPSGNAQLYFKRGYAVGGVLGFKVLNHLRFEGEVTYRKHKGDRFTFGGIPMEGDLPGHIASVAYLINGYFDIVNYCGFTPYIGGGVGRVRLINHIETLESETNEFAYQLGGGLRYQFCNRVFADLGYRYFKSKTPTYSFKEPNTQADSQSTLPYRTQNIMLTLGYTFG